MRQNRKLLQLLLSCLLCSMLVGCVSSKYIEPKKYLFDPQAKFVKDFKDGYKCSVFVDYVTAVAPFDQVDFLYRIKTGRYINDYYNGFLVTPSQQFDSLLKDYLKVNGHFNVDISGSSESSYKLRTSLLELYADYRDSNRPQAVVALNFLLTKLENGKTIVLLDRTIRSNVPIEEKNTNCLLRSWNAGIKNIFSKITRELNNKVNCTK